MSSSQKLDPETRLRVMLPVYCNHRPHGGRHPGNRRKVILSGATRRALIAEYGEKLQQNTVSFEALLIPSGDRQHYYAVPFDARRWPPDVPLPPLETWKRLEPKPSRSTRAKYKRPHIMPPE